MHGAMSVTAHHTVLIEHDKEEEAISYEVVVPDIWKVAAE